MLVFVYGTLKRGHGNHRLLEKADFVKETLIPSHKLFYAGFPVMTPAYDDTQFVKGEVFDIHDDQQTLANLDRLEGEGFMYDRACIHDVDGVEVNAYIGVPKYWDNFHNMRSCKFQIHPEEKTIHYWVPER